MTPAADARANYETVIGLEVHAQLLTRSKCFCACSTEFGAPPNSNTCPVCLGLPGALPVLNREVVVMATKAALALNCRLNRVSQFARKNYFYPDLPKGYQISQYDRPLAQHGFIAIEMNGARKRIGVHRLHIEEDAGKSIHEGFPDSDEKSYIDLNRSGVPLIEIVSEPDLRSTEEAYAYLTKLKQLLQYIGVCNCDMEKGNLRCDANVSVRLMGQTELGTKTELKNLNSFKFLQKALAYEINRQIEVLESGGRLIQETRLWNVEEERTTSMRSKEEAHDYRYFPEPDLLPLIVDEDFQEAIRRSMPELPDAKKARFMEQYALSDYDASLLIAEKSFADWFEAAVQASGRRELAKPLANWMLGDMTAAMKQAEVDVSNLRFRPADLAELAQLIEAGTISGKMGKDVFAEMFATGKRPSEIVREKNMVQISDEKTLEPIIRQVIAQNEANYKKYKSGKTNVLAYFVGQVMKETRGQANPRVLNELVKKILDE